MSTGLVTRLVLIAALAWAAADVLRLAWTCDDAYISFRYAWNWVHGHGLVFNPGETDPVEGYTNFLWTLLSALPIALGFDPTRPMLAAALVCAGIALLATFALAQRLGADDRQALLAVALVGLHDGDKLGPTEGDTDDGDNDD